CIRGPKFSWIRDAFDFW
nr:immunoglobulin heavy chain junction region [Macaca mulatta]